MRGSTIFLLLVVLGLGLYIGLFEHKKDTTDRKRAIARRVLRLDPARITSLRVVEPDLQFVATKAGDRWQLTSPVAGRADAGEVERLIETFDLLEQSDVIRGRDQRKEQLTLAHFGLEQPRVRVTLTSPDREWTLLIGNDTPVGGNLFLKEANDSSVFIAPTNLLSALPASVEALRDRRIFEGFPTDVTRVELRRREGVLSLSRGESSTWRTLQPWSGRAAAAAVQSLLDQIFASRIVDFVAESFDAASLYGLDEPIAQVALTGDRRYGEQTLLLGKPVARDTNQVYATTSGGTVFTVNRSVLEAFTVKADTLRDRKLIPLSARDINYIRAQEGERAVSLGRTESGTWEILEPARHNANQRRLESALAEWTSAPIENFLETASTNLLDAGLQPTARRITFSRTPPASTTNAVRAKTSDDEVTVWLSSLPPTNDLALVKLAGEETLFQIPAKLLASLPAAPLWYRNSEVLTMDPATVRSLTILKNGVEQSVARETSSNAFRAAMATNIADTATVERTLKTICSLQAASFVADAVADVSPFGLTEPTAQLTAGLQGGPVPMRTLLLGNQNEQGDSYAMLRGGDIVFTIAKGARDNLFASLYKSAPASKDTPLDEQPLPPSAEDADIEPE